MGKLVGIGQFELGTAIAISDFAAIISAVTGL